MPPWEFEQNGEKVRVDPTGNLIVRAGEAVELGVQAAIAGAGVICLVEDGLRPHLENRALEPLLKPWWPTFCGPCLYSPGRRLMLSPLRAFVDFIKASSRPIDTP